MNWTIICPLDRVQPERGVAAIVGDTQVAVIRTYHDELYAIGNHDPIARAHVMSRGIVGTRAGTPTIASPLHKQVYDLRTGVCLDVPGIRLPTYAIRCSGGLIEVAVA